MDEAIICLGLSILFSFMLWMGMGMWHGGTKQLSGLSSLLACFFCISLLSAGIAGARIIYLLLAFLIQSQQGCAALWIASLVFKNC